MPDRDELLSSSKVTKGALVLFGLVALGVLTVFLMGGRVNYDLDLRPEDYMSILSHLAIIALLTERFVEIFTSVIRKPDRILLEGDLREATTNDKINEAQQALDTYKAKTGIFAIVLSFITGLIIASVGVRVLGPLFDTNDLTRAQSLIFDSIDIIITSGLIAGGSKGVNTLTSSIGAVFDSMKYQSRANQEKARQDISKQ